jgi:type 1 glutamine amidotransferase
MTKYKEPTDLTRWQKRYGRGFVMYSLKNGRAILADPDYEKLIKKAEKKKVNSEKVSVIYVPDPNKVSIFPLSL